MAFERTPSAAVSWPWSRSRKSPKLRPFVTNLGDGLGVGPHQHLPQLGLVSRDERGQRLADFLKCPSTLQRSMLNSDRERQRRPHGCASVAFSSERSRSI